MIPYNDSFQAPMLNGGSQDQGRNSTFDERLQPDPKIEARRREVYDQRPTAVKLAEQDREAAEQARLEQQAKMHEVARLITDALLKVARDRAAKLAVQKAVKAQAAHAQAARIQAAMRYGEVAELVIKALTEQGYYIKDAQNAVPVVVARLRKMGYDL